MSIWLVYATYLAAVNPPRLRPALPERGGRVRWPPTLVGAGVTLAFGVAIVALSTELLEALDITSETWRIAAGMVAAVVGFRVLAFPDRPDEPRFAGGWAALVPVAFPLMITPELVALVSIFGATEPATRSVGGLITAVALGAASGAIGHRHRALWLAGARFFAAVLILGGVALIVEGIRDV